MICQELFLYIEFHINNFSPKESVNKGLSFHKNIMALLNTSLDVMGLKRP